jgi:anti-sigma regulatory factor (Ser/Thr protein kinase)
MSFTEKKREAIKKYLLRKIDRNDPEVIDKTMDNFGISVTTVKRYLQEFLDADVIEQTAGNACPYRLVEQEYRAVIPLRGTQPDEDQLYMEHIESMLAGCSGKARRIWQYACEEMLNNAIEHSEGEYLGIHVMVNALNTSVVITDDGRGVFQTLLTYMQENGWKNPRVEDALVELYKGRITRDCQNHSGEGIFFTSKLLDHFVLWSDSVIFQRGCETKPDVVKSHLAAYAARMWNQRTTVVMRLENETERDSKEVFDMYANVDEGLIRTRIPVREVCLERDPVARSQARRICNRLEEFREVILDFEHVEFMGQGFADELFRVYAVAHPQITLTVVNMIPDVERMIRHVSRGKIAENIREEI